MIKKILIFIWLFLLFITNTFAFDANLKVDKTNLDINDVLNLRVELSSTEWWEIAIKQIKWLEKFNLISQSQSQSSSSSVVVVNWKTQSQTKTTINLDLILKPKNKWDFEIWPAILSKGKEEIKTNKIEIKVSSNWVLLNTQKNIKVQKNIWNSVTTNIWNFWKNNVLDKEIETYDNVEKKNFWNYSILILFIVILFITLIWFYFIFKKKDILQKNIKKSDLKKEAKYEDKDSEKEEKDIINKEDPVLEIEEKTKEIKYPELNEENFISKIEGIFREKIKNKFNIKNIETKTLEEISKNIEKNEKIDTLIELINKAKYSNYIWNNEKILELVKEL